MAEGNEVWAREDELDLGQDEHDSQSLGPNTILDHDQPGPSPQKPEATEAEVELLDTIDDAQDHAFEKALDADGPQLPQTPPPRQAQVDATPGSVDETASTPDDTPSLHVSDCNLRDADALRPDWCLIEASRVLFCLPRAAAHWLFGAHHESALAQPTVHLTFVSSPDYLRLRSAHRGLALRFWHSYTPDSHQSPAKFHRRRNQITKFHQARGMSYDGQNCGRLQARPFRRLESATSGDQPVWRFPRQL